ncbi:2Fe-2S iron-sulfur cluster-binding protein [Streptomyces sp. NPDC044780]|uniref:2Fe-2S iron-sulfur cluster-binding protein n=1 Tax=unclassified Streptomyces TaxID=2593676 RepID=UPI0033E075BD
MSDEQQPHRQEPVSGWQPMPHGPEYDAESTAFVQLPPDYAHPNPADPSGHWDPLAAPGTGYAPPPMDAGHGDPSQGGQWQPAGHDQGAAHDQGMNGHWTTADAAGAYLYGGLHDPHGSGQWAMPAEDQQGHHPQHTGHWPAPAAEEPVDDWPVPTPSDGTDGPVHTSQWTIPVAGDDGVDETGEYRVDDHPGPAAAPYGGHPDGPQDPQTTAQLRMPFIAGATPQHQSHEAHQPHQSHQPGQPHEAHQPHPGQQQGHTGQWSVPAAEEGVEDSGEYAVEGHPGPAAPPAAATPPPARRPLGMPDRDEPVPAADPAWPGPSAGDSGQFAVEGHQGLHTPQHGGPVPGERQPAADDPAWGHGGSAAGDSGEFPVDGQHAGLHTPPHGSPAPGLPQDAAWQGEFTGERFEGERFEGERFEGERFDGEPFEGEQLDGDRFAGDAHGHAPHPGPEAGAGHTDAPADGRDAAEAPAEPSAEAVPDGAGPEAAEPAGGPEPAAAEGEFTAAADAAEGPAPAEPRPETPAEIPEAADAPAEPVPGPAPAEAAPAGPVASPIDEFPSHSEHPLTSYVLHVNGADRPVTDVWIGESLLYVLRERLGLAGAKDGCSQGECGACSVQVDGRLVASCLVPAATAAGSEVRTVEGLAAGGQPSDVQRALAECGAVQCGFCVPGLAMTVHDLLEGNHAPTDQQTRQAISGNLCRCSGYRGVLDAVREVVASREAAAAEADADGGPDAHQDPARIPHQAGPHGITGNGSVNGSGSGRASA